jgi:NTE family protein
MKEYEAGDFKKSNGIMEKGNQLAYNVLPQLIQLANQLKQYNALQPKQDLCIEEKQLKINEVYLDTVSSTQTLSFFKKRLDIKPNSATNIHKITKAIQAIYATRYIQKASYELEQSDSDTTSYDLRINLEEEEKWRFKSALHYDNELGAGFILNLTARNVLGKASRLLATVDLAQNFKFRVNYRKYLGNSPISFNTQLLSERTLYKFTNLEGKPIEEYNNDYKYLTLGFNANLSRNIGWYSGFMGEKSNIFPRLESDYYIADGLDKIDAVIHGFQNRLTINTLDHPFFPKKGISFFTEYRRNISARENILFQDTSSSGISKVYQESGGYNKLQVGLKALIPIGKKLSVLINSDMGVTGRAKIATQILNDTIETEDSDEPLDLFSDNYYIGGIIQRSRSNAIPFWGVKENNYQGSNFATLQIGIQYELIHNLFITPSVNALYITDRYQGFFKNIPKQLFRNYYYHDDSEEYSESLYTYSLNIGYKTPFGPILINVSKASSENRIAGYLSIGYNF